MYDLPLDSVVIFDECTADPTASGGVSDADSTPTFSVFEGATDSPIVGPTNFTKRTSLTGNYRGTFTMSAANGFEVGKFYNVISTAIVGGVTGKKKSATIRCVAAELIAGSPVVDLGSVLGTAIQSSDLTIASATASTVTLPSTYSDGTTLPDDDRHVNNALSVVDGTGQGQLVILTTAAAGARVYNVLSGSMPVQLDNTSKCIVIGPASSTDAASIRSAVGLATANLDTQLSGIDSKTTNLPSDPADASVIAGLISTLSTTVGLIKTQTDKFTFTVTNRVDVNVRSVNSVVVDGVGTTLDPWGPA